MLLLIIERTNISVFFDDYDEAIDHCVSKDFVKKRSIKKTKTT